MGDGLNIEGQCYRFPSTADANLRLLLVLMGVANHLCRKGLWTVEAAITTFHIRQHDVLGKVANHNVVAVLRSQRVRSNIYQHVGIVKFLQVGICQRLAAMPHDGRNMFSHIMHLAGFLHNLCHRDITIYPQHAIVVKGVVNISFHLKNVFKILPPFSISVFLCSTRWYI